MENKQIVIFGEVLFDQFPDGKIVLGGAPFNIAWHLQGFGISPLFISRVGNDFEGEKIKQSMEDWGMNLSGIQTDNQHTTGIVKVEFHNNEPYYNILENSAYDFIESSYLPYISQKSILYHGSLALRNNVSRITLNNIKKNSYPQVFLDVNLRYPYWSLNLIKSLLSETLWLKLNEDELSLIVPEENNIESKIKYLFQHYSLNQITLTQGEKGAITFTSNNKNYQVSPSKKIPIIDTVGAGDAFCSVLILGILKQWDVETTIKKAQKFASKIISIQGATKFDLSFYNEL